MSRSTHSRRVSHRPSVRVVLYSTSGCYLCDSVQAELSRMGVPYDVVDATHDQSRFLRAPILEVDGTEVAEGDISVAEIVRALRG